MSGDEHDSFLFTRCVSRREMIVTTGALALLGVAACGSPAAPPGPVAGTFIGTVGADELIALVVGPAGDARGLLYGPAPVGPGGVPGRGTYNDFISEWFDGVTLAGTKLDGSSAGGNTLTGTLAADAVLGTVTGPTTGSRPFEATAATGTAGLFDVTRNPADGTLRGSAATGARLSATIPPGPPEQVVDIVLMITPAGGAPLQKPVRFFRSPPQVNPPMGFIVSQTGEVRGGPRKTRAVSRDTQFTCPLID